MLIDFYRMLIDFSNTKLTSKFVVILKRNYVHTHYHVTVLRLQLILNHKVKKQPYRKY